MSEVYSINGENFIDFEIDSLENTISFEYSSTFTDLNTITDFELFKIYNLLKSNKTINVQNIDKQDLKKFYETLQIYFVLIQLLETHPYQLLIHYHTLKKNHLNLMRRLCLKIFVFLMTSIQNRYLII